MKSILRALNYLEEGALAVGLLGLALMTFVEVITRYAFNHSFTWFEEFARYFALFLTFLGASLGVKYGMHFSMDFVVTRVSYRLGNFMRAFSFLVCGVLFAAIAWLGWERALQLKRFGTTSAAMGLPMFWAYLPIAVFGATMAMRFLNQAYRHGLAMFRNEPLGGEVKEPGQ